MLDPDEIDRSIAEALRAKHDDEIVIACQPVSSGPPIVDSGVVTCARCHRRIWISTRVLDAMPKQATTMCTECTMKKIAERQ